MLAKHLSSSATTTTALVDNRRLRSKKKSVAFVSSSSPSSSSNANEDCSNNENENARRSDVNSISRRRQLALIAATAMVLPLQNPKQQNLYSFARNDGPTVLVIGSTGQTGKLVVSSLSSTNRANVIAGCRSLEKAKKLKLDQNGVELKGGVDVTDTTENLALAWMAWMWSSSRRVLFREIRSR